LILAQDFSGQESKLHTNPHGDGNYLQQISQQWSSATVTPVFVSEGTSKQKLNAIARSRYLDTVYREVLPEKKESIVIYGWSMGENDSHILDALKKVVHQGWRYQCMALIPLAVMQLKEIKSGVW
jgi:hypothetical protein